MPVFFLAHGSPANAIETNHFTDDWHTLLNSPTTPETPSAIVVFSAHWHVPGVRVLSSAKPKTIHDFGGFPPIMYEQQYPCPGNPKLAADIVQTLSNSDFDAATEDTWGLDHGTWCILKHLYPKADIPVLQISLDNRNDDVHYHLAIAQSLKAYRDQGVLFIGSGNIVHNIMKWMTSRPGDSTAWAVEFDNAMAEAVKTRNIAALADWASHPYARDAVPTIEHFLPLIYAWGLTDDSERQTHSAFPFNDLGTACSRSIRFDTI